MNKKIEDFKVSAIIHTVGLNNNLTDEQVRQIIESQFRFTYEEIRKLNFKDLTDEEIDALKTNFYYKYLGKLYTNSESFNSIKRKEDYVIKLKQKEEDGRNAKLELGTSTGDDTDVSLGTGI